MTLIRTKFIGVKIYSETVTLIFKYSHLSMEDLFPRKSLLNFIHSDITYIKSLFLRFNNV
jgi:hypothetical protein